MAKFPKTLYVTREYPANDESYLMADENQPEPGETVPVAIYQLVEVATLEVTRTIKRNEIQRRNLR